MSSDLNHEQNDKLVTSICSTVLIHWPSTAMQTSIQDLQQRQTALQQGQMALQQGQTALQQGLAALQTAVDQILARLPEEPQRGRRGGRGG